MKITDKKCKLWHYQVNRNAAKSRKYFKKFLYYWTFYFYFIQSKVDSKLLRYETLTGRHWREKRKLLNLNCILYCINSFFKRDLLLVTSRIVKISKSNKILQVDETVNIFGCCCLFTIFFVFKKIENFIFFKLGKISINFRRQNYNFWPQF